MEVTEWCRCRCGVGVGVGDGVEDLGLPKAVLVEDVGGVGWDGCGRLENKVVGVAGSDPVIKKGVVAEGGGGRGGVGRR